MSNHLPVGSEHAVNPSNLEKRPVIRDDLIMVFVIEIGEMQKFSRLVEQAGESNNKRTVNCVFLQQSKNNYTL